MVLSYILLLPMLFFASGGEFSFESKLAKTQFGSYQNGMTAMQSADELTQRASELAIALSVVVCLLAQSFRKVVQDFKALPLLWMIVLWAGASTLWSLDPLSSARNTIYLLLNTAFALYLRNRYSSGDLMGLIAIVGAACLIANYTVCILLPTYGMTQSASGVAWQGICAHKNLCAYMTVFFLSAVLCSKPSSALAQFSRMIYITASILLIVMTQSRTGWILTAFVLFFIPAIRLVKRMAPREATIAALFGVLPAAVVVWLSVSYLPTFFSLIGKDPSMNGRLPIWTAVLASILKHPLVGYGYRAFWHNGVSGENASIVTAVGWNPRFAHNGLLEIGLELGGGGMLLALLTIAKALLDAKRCFRSGSSAAVEWYICVVFLTIIVNIDEGTLFGCIHLGWTLFVIACAGLSAAARGGGAVSTGTSWNSGEELQERAA